MHGATSHSATLTLNATHAPSQPTNPLPDPADGRFFLSCNLHGDLVYSPAGSVGPHRTAAPAAAAGGRRRRRRMFHCTRLSPGFRRPFELSDLVFP